MEQSFSKKLYILMAVLLMLAGIAVGAVAIWQVFSVYPYLVEKRPLRLVFYIASAGLSGLVFLFSTNMVMSFFALVGRTVSKKLRVISKLSFPGVMLGLLMTLAVTATTDFLLSLFLYILALRILLDIIVFLVFLYVFILLGTHLVQGTKKKQDADPSPLPKTGRRAAGYLISGEALSSSRIVPMLSTWLEGEKYVLAKTVTNLVENQSSESAQAALKSFQTLSDAKVIKVIETNDDRSERDQLIKTAIVKRLKIIVLESSDLGITADRRVNVLVLGEL